MRSATASVHAAWCGVVVMISSEKASGWEGVVIKHERGRVRVRVTIGVGRRGGSGDDAGR